MENWIYPAFLDHIYNPPLKCTFRVTKTRSRGQLPYPNFKLGNSNTPPNLPSFSKYCVNVYPYIILGCTEPWSLKLLQSVFGNM